MNVTESSTYERTKGKAKTVYLLTYVGGVNMVLNEKSNSVCIKTETMFVIKGIRDILARTRYYSRVEHLLTDFCLCWGFTA